MFPKKGGWGSGIPLLYVNFWWPLLWPWTFLAKSEKKGGSTGLGSIPEKYQFF